MNAEQSRKNVFVQRITIDEKLTDDLIRLLISPLAKGVKEFYDGKNDWEEEQECFIQPDTYIQEMDIPLSKKEKWPWIDLQEGQVFLSGQFKILGSEEAPKKFVIAPRQEEFLRIDKRVRKDIQQLYSKALERRI